MKGNVIIMKNISRKLIAVLLSVVMIFAISINSLAAEDVSNDESISSAEVENHKTGALLDDPTLTKSVQAKLKKETDEKDKLATDWFNKNRIKKGTDGNFSILSTINVIYVEGKQQENGYYCGPASVQQSLSFHKYISGSSTALPSQDTIADKAGTTTNGSTTTGLATALNFYSGTFGTYYYVASDVTDQSDPRATFITRINYDLSNEAYAPVVLYDTRYLPRYGGVYVRHYNTVSGYYMDDESAEELRSEDPHYSSTYYGEYWDPMGTTTENGAFKAVYKADQNGTNKAMAW